MNMNWKHKKVYELTGGSFNSNLRMVASIVNKNAYVLREAIQKIDELAGEVEALKNENTKLKKKLQKKSDNPITMGPPMRE